MRESVYEVAAKAAPALRRAAPAPKIRGRVVKDFCEICQKTHGYVLGEPRCVAPTLRRVAAMALLLGCMTLSGCALAPKVDANYRARVDSFSCPVGVVYKDGVLTVGIAPSWHYRLPALTQIPEPTLKTKL